MLAGVYMASKKDGTLSYRASITFRNKHISLGSFLKERLAHEAYKEAQALLFDESIHLEAYRQTKFLPFDKWVVLLNFRDNGMYIKTPIYMKHRYFIYYINRKLPLKFDVDDLFYYSHHKIMKRGGHLFVSDYGMQVNILSRYGIKNFAVAGKDYRFANGDNTDFRYGNIEIINRYHGVTKTLDKGFPVFTTKIHINGDFIVGRYGDDITAAIAYNKAADILRQKGVTKNFPVNYIGEIDEIEYASIYSKVRISKKIRTYEI